jgi:beta-lactamase class A
VLLERMIVDSSNIATNLVLGCMGFDPVHRLLRWAGADGVALRHLIGDPGAGTPAQQNSVTTDSLARLLALLAAEQLLPPPATRRVLSLLARQRHRRSIPLGLPSGTWVADKPGWTDAVEHDVALVRPGRAPEYVLAICTSGAGAEGVRVISRISVDTWEHWSTWHAS